MIQFHWTCPIAVTLVFMASATKLQAVEPASRIKAGIIGCDAHALDWTRIVNNPKATGELVAMTIVAAYPGGSPDIPESMDYLKKSVEPMKALGVEMVDSIEALLAKVDVVLLLSIDGRPHLEQAKPVFAARKKVFIDKPIGGSLVDAIRIFELAKQYGVPCFSSSALRFSPGTVAVCHDPRVGAIHGCDAFSPCPIEPHHPRGSRWLVLGSQLRPEPDVAVGRDVSAVDVDADQAVILRVDAPPCAVEPGRAACAFVLSGHPEAAGFVLQDGRNRSVDQAVSRGVLSPLPAIETRSTVWSSQPDRIADREDLVVG